MDEIKIIIRQPLPEDKNFILSTWLKGQYYGCAYFKQIPSNIYYLKYADKIIEKLSQPQMRMTVACDASNPHWVVGFAVFDDHLHWVHVKKDFRGMGIARLMLQGKEFKVVKSTTKKGHEITVSKNLIFDPL